MILTRQVNIFNNGLTWGKGNEQTFKLFLVETTSGTLSFCYTNSPRGTFDQLWFPYVGIRYRRCLNGVVANYFGHVVAEVYT